MKLWYTKWELSDAKIEAQRLCDQINAEIPIYIRGNVELRMAWREDIRSEEIVPQNELRVYGEIALKTFIPEAELLVNGEVAKRDLLDFLLLDLLCLQMKCLKQNGNGPSLDIA